MENYKELLLKYLKNECEAEELRTICNWLNKQSDTGQIEKLIREDWEKFSVDSEGHANLSESFESLKLKLKEGAKQSVTVPASPKHKGHVRKLMIRIAAGFLMPIAVGVLTYYMLNHSKGTNDQIFNEISVPLGSKITVLLGDGTKIWLNSGSKLKYPQKFQGNFREVSLIGEAFFDVTKDAHKPFIVKTSSLNIKVLGTTFNVKSYPEEGTIETTLVKGAITITNNNTSLQKEAIYLKPNQRATYIKEAGKLVLADVEKKVVKVEPIIKKGLKRLEKMILSDNVDIVQFTAWKDDKLVFKNEDFEGLCTKLERWYDVKINIDDPDLKKFHYTGILQKETIDDVIKLLKLMMPFQYEVNHSVIDIWGDHGKKPELNQ